MAKKISQGLDVTRLDQLILDLGVRVRVWHSTICPNMSSLESIDHDINCSVCNNNMIDFDCQETTALFQQQDMAESFKVQGTYHIDKILVTFLSGITLQTFTKVELLDFEEDFFELVQRKTGSATDVLKYSACKVLGAFAIVSNTLVRYHADTDFTIDVNGNVKWIGTHKPADNDVYSIYYQYHPVFRAIEAVHRDRYTQFNLKTETIKGPKKTVNGVTYVKLPETWVLKRDYLIERRDKNNNLIAPNPFVDPNAT